MDQAKLTGRLIKAARALSGIRQVDLAEQARISLPTMKRIEGSKGIARGEPENIAAVVALLEASGVMFIDSNGYGPGVRLRNRP